MARPDGRLLVTVPAYRWLWSHHDDAHHHFRRYTRARLEQRAAASGWRPERATYFNSTLLVPIAAVRLAQRLRGSEPASSDYERTPRPLGAALAGIMRAESPPRSAAGAPSPPACRSAWCARAA